MVTLETRRQFVMDAEHALELVCSLPGSEEAQEALWQLKQALSSLLHQAETEEYHRQLERGYHKE